MASLIVDTMKEGYYKIGRNRGYAPEKLSENPPKIALHRGWAFPQKNHDTGRESTGGAVYQEWHSEFADGL